VCVRANGIFSFCGLSSNGLIVGFYIFHRSFFVFSFDWMKCGVGRMVAFRVLNKRIAKECRGNVVCSRRSFSTSLETHRGLRHAALDLENVQWLDLSASQDLVCKNMMCEKVGEVCVCKLAVWASQSRPRLQQLKHLDLSHNGLEILPDSVFDLLTLRSLNVSHNKFHELPEEISRLTQLTTLDIRGNAELNHLPAALSNPEEVASLQLRQILVDQSMEKFLGNVHPKLWGARSGKGGSDNTVVLERNV
jgi:hypothetical protein